MRTKTSWTLLGIAVLGLLLLLSAAPLRAQEPVETIFTDAIPSDDQPPPPAKVYCVYKIVTTQGNCGRFGVGSKLCIDCPGTGTCPSPAGAITNFVYVDAFGNVICKGTWSRSFDLARPNACIICNNGQTGYKFVN